MFQTRIENLQKKLDEFELDALLVTSIYNIAYFTGLTNFSIEEREAWLLITKQDALFFTDPRSSETVRHKAPFVKLHITSSEKPLLAQMNELVHLSGIKNFGFEEEHLSYKEVMELEEEVESEFTPTQGIVEELRTIKDAEEIENLKKAAELSDKAFSFILTKFSEGITELQIKGELENFIRLEGGDVAFSSIVAFGKNAATPHHVSNTSPLTTGDAILLDFGAKIAGYCNDMTRTIFFKEVSELNRNVYNAVLGAQQLAIDYANTHTSSEFETKLLHEVTKSHITSLQFPELPHALGHGVGLQVHEEPVISPYSDEALQAGMVITIEPGVYLENQTGVRIEDTLVITESGIESLNKTTKDIIII